MTPRRPLADPGVSFRNRRPLTGAASVRTIVVVRAGCACGQRSVGLPGADHRAGIPTRSTLRGIGDLALGSGASAAAQRRIMDVTCAAI